MEVVMASKPLPCKLGLHSWGTENPTDERALGSDRPQVCRRCGKRREAGPGDVQVFPGGPT